MSNYHGITLLSSMGKIFTSIICSRLTEWAEERSLVPDSQFGFRQNRRATDCIFILNALVENALCNHTPLYVYYVGFKKKLLTASIILSCGLNYVNSVSVIKC